MNKIPIIYYGGKSRMSKKIIERIPKHTVYVEPFCGGASVFFHKPWPKNLKNTGKYIEVLNDTNKYVYTLFKVLRDPEKSEELIRRLEATPYSRDVYHDAVSMTDGSDIDIAWAAFVGFNQSFSGKFGHGWSYGLHNKNQTVTFRNKVINIESFALRLMDAYIENLDAIKCIKKWDSPSSFFYIDPPYPETDQGHYSGYSFSDYMNLVNLLKEIKGSFILSSYKMNVDYPAEWVIEEFNHYHSVNNGKHRSVDDMFRTEVLISHTNSDPVREDLRQLYKSDKLDCFK